jgi:hypothetical protein
MLVEFVGDEMHFQVISRAGKTVDSGIIYNRNVTPPPPSTTEDSKKEGR